MQTLQWRHEISISWCGCLLDVMFSLSKVSDAGGSSTGNLCPYSRGSINIDHIPCLIAVVWKQCRYDGFSIPFITLDCNLSLVDWFIGLNLCLVCYVRNSHRTCSRCFCVSILVGSKCYLNYKMCFCLARPTSLDALIFGYLAPLLKAPLPNNQLQTHLLQCDNLCRLCNDILTVFFPADVEGEYFQRTSCIAPSEQPHRYSVSFRLDTDIVVPSVPLVS